MKSALGGLAVGTGSVRLESEPPRKGVPPFRAANTGLGFRIGWSEAFPPVPPASAQWPIVQQPVAQLGFGIYVASAPSSFSPVATIFSEPSGSGRCSNLVVQRCPHPDIVFFWRRQDHRHRLWMNATDFGVRLAGKKRENVGSDFAFPDLPHAGPVGRQAGETHQRPALIGREPDRHFLAVDRVVFGKRRGAYLPRRTLDLPVRLDRMIDIISSVGDNGPEDWARAAESMRSILTKRGWR